MARVGSKALLRRKTLGQRVQEEQKGQKTPCMQSPLAQDLVAQEVAQAIWACPHGTDLASGMSNLQVAGLDGASVCNATGNCGTPKCGLLQRVQANVYVEAISLTRTSSKDGTYT